MDFAFDDRTLGLIDEVNAFMDEFVYPAEATMHGQIEQSVAGDDWATPAIVGEIRAEAKSRGLWNFSSPVKKGPG